MAVTFKKLSSPKTFNRKILVYGSPGAGKTFFIGEAQKIPAMADVLVLSCAGGLKTLEGNDGITAGEVRTTQDTEAVLWRVINKDPEFVNIKTVVLDDFSELARRSLQDIAEVAKREDNQLKDYMTAKNRLLRILRLARDIPQNLFITCWSKKTFPMKPGTQIQDKDAKPTVVTVDVSDSLLSTLMGLVDDVFYLSQDEKTGKRYLYTGTHDGVVAKMRLPTADAMKNFSTEASGVAYPIIADPSLTDLFERYQRSYNSK